jgi:hypothetical protein
MDTTTLDSVAEINSGLNSTATGTADYGTTFTFVWNTAKTQLTVTLGTGETIAGSETVNPAATVTDVAGNADATAAPGPAIPTPPIPTYTVGTAETRVETEDGRITIHFPAGSFAADTTVTIQLLAACPIAPEGYIIGATCFSITAGAQLLKSIDICIKYSSADVAAAGGDPHKLRLYDVAEGKVLSTDVDERAQTACARVDHLSDFALVAGPGPGGGWWSVWWHVFLVVLGVAAVAATGVLLWRRYRYY